jgi:two-component sensor histidine kinase
MPTPWQSRPNVTDWIIGLTGRVPDHSFGAVMLAVACVAVAMAVRTVFGWLGADLPFATYFPAVLVAGMLSGLRAALLVIIGSVVTVWWAFIHPHFEFGPLDTTQKLNFALFVFTSGCILVVTHLYQRALTRLRERERERELITQELDHRRKNTYAVLEAIVQKTLEDDPARANAIVGRLRSVKYTNDLISHSSAHTVFLRTLLQQEFAAFGENRLFAEGLDIELSPDTARNLALVFHELVTNAAKYGALSRPGGSVYLEWQTDESAVSLRWRERGGPLAAPPAQPGFGSKLVRQCLKSLSGEIVNTFAPDGLRCDITFHV